MPRPNVEIAYRVITKATDPTTGKPVRFESFDRARVVQRVQELKGRDPKTKFVGIPVAGR